MCIIFSCKCVLILRASPSKLLARQQRLGLKVHEHGTAASMDPVGWYTEPLWVCIRDLYILSTGFYIIMTCDYGKNSSRYTKDMFNCGWRVKNNRLGQKMWTIIETTLYSTAVLCITNKCTTGTRKLHSVSIIGLIMWRKYSKLSSILWCWCAFVVRCGIWGR